MLSLPHGFRYFSLVNYQNAPARTHLLDLETFYTEQNVDWAPVVSLPLELSAQWTIVSGPGNDSLRFGVLWRVSRTPVLEQLFTLIRLSYFVDFHALQLTHLSGGYRSQIEHAYRLDVLPCVFGDRIYLGGFTDHNLWFGAPTGTPTNRIVSELQVGVRIVGGLYAVAEGRHNGNLRSS